MVNSDRKQRVKLFLLRQIVTGMTITWKLAYAITAIVELQSMPSQMIMCYTVLKVTAQHLVIVSLARLSLRLHALNWELFTILLPQYIAIQILSLRRRDLMITLLVRHRVTLRKMLAHRRK